MLVSSRDGCITQVQVAWVSVSLGFENRVRGGAFPHRARRGGRGSGAPVSSWR